MEKVIVSDKLKEHRVIGIRHSLKKFKDAGLVEDESYYPSEAVENVQDEVLAVAQTWYEIGAKRGAIETINAFLDGKFKVNSNTNGELEVIAQTKTQTVSWSKRLKVTVGNEKKLIQKQKYQLTLKDLEFDV